MATYNLKNLLAHTDQLAPADFKRQGNEPYYIKRLQDRELRMYFRENPKKKFLYSSFLSKRAVSTALVGFFESSRRNDKQGADVSSKNQQIAINNVGLKC